MFEYRVNWYNSFEDKEECSRGIVAGNTYIDAISHVVHDYGEQNIIDIYLQALEDTNTIELETIKEQFDL